jgi:hypothetical protein
MDEVDVTAIKNKMRDVNGDFRLTCAILRTAIPSTATPALDAMEQMFREVTALCVLLAETPFDAAE